MWPPQTVAITKWRTFRLWTRVPKSDQNFPKFRRPTAQTPLYPHRQNGFLPTICQNFPKFAKIFQNLPKFSKICQNFPKFAKICQNFPKVPKVPQNAMRLYIYKSPTICTINLQQYVPSISKLNSAKPGNMFLSVLMYDCHLIPRTVKCTIV